MSDASAMMLICVACVAVTLAAGARSWRIPLRVSVVVALALRILVAIIASGHTPGDAESWFRSAAELAGHGHDPSGYYSLTRWNFLPTLPYVWSLLLHLHLPWDVTNKGLAIAADCVNTVLVAALAASRKRLRAFQYAVSPLALLVVGWHGQMEPIVLACGLSSLVLLRRRKYALAGGVVGLGVAIKTWPIVFALAVFRGAPRRRWLGVLAAIVAVPLTVFLTMPLFLSTDLARDARIVLRYRSRIGGFGWTAVVNLVNGTQNVGARGGILSVEQRISTVLLIAAAALVLWVWRKARAEIFMLAMLLSFLVTSAGFGVQYLMWPLPLAIACATRRTWLYIWPATIYAFLFYVQPFTVRMTDTRAFGVYSIPVVICALLALPIDQRGRIPAVVTPTVPEPAADGETTAAPSPVAL